MKKLLLPLLLLLLSGIAFGQGSPCPNYQQFGSATTRTSILGIAQGQKGVTIGRYTDTTTANSSGCADYYPGTFIVTDDPRDVLWQRNYNATAWISRAGSGSITSLTFLTDSSVVICFADGSCDTIPINSFTNVVNNIVQNFNDSTVYNINDSTLVICPLVGSCDTIDLGTTNTYSIFLDTTSNNFFLVTCDTVQNICVGDSCYMQQVCDTILIPRPPSNIYQNALRKVGPIVQHGQPFDGAGYGSLIEDTWLYTDFQQYVIKGRPLNRQVLKIDHSNWSQVSSSISSWKHYGAFRPGWGLLDEDNPVNLYVNYTNPFVIPSNGPFTGDTIGFLGNRYAYMLMTNARGDHFSYGVDNVNAKQSGVALHTFGSDKDAITLFGNQTPSGYLLNGNPASTTTLLDSRIAIFKTDKNIQFPGYDSSRNDGPTNKAIWGADEEGNLMQGTITAGSSITIINDTTITICSFGVNLCDTFIVNNIGVIQTVFILTDTSLLVCDSVGVCDTLFVGSTSFVDAPLVIQNSVWVTKNGNDAQGVRNRVDKPFLTIRAAETAAQTGDVIIVWPGIYEETDTLWTKNVSYTFMGKGEVRLVTSLDNGILFYDHGVAKNSVFDGPGWTFTARGNQKAFQHSDSTVIRIIADNITSQTSPALDFYEGRSYVKASKIYTANSFATVYLLEEHCVIDADSIVVGINGNAIYIEDCPYLNITAGQVICAPTNGDYLIYGTATNAVDTILITADLIRGGTEWPLYIVGDATEVYVNAKKIVAKTDCVVVSGTDQMTVTAQEIESTIETDTDGIIHAEGGGLLVIGAKITRHPSATGYDLLSSIGGILTVSGVSYDQTRVNITGASPGTIKRIDTLWHGSNMRFTNARWETDTAQIVAANNLELGKANVHLVSGATQITAIYTAGWQAGSIVLLQFSGAPLVKHATAGGAGTGQIKLAGATDFQAAADDVIGLEYDGTYWHEISRKLAAGTATITADNGLIKNTATNVQLGSPTAPGAPLLHVTHIDAGALYQLNINGSISGTNWVFSANNTGTGAGVYGTALSGNAVGGAATSGVGGAFRATTGIGITASSVSNFAGMFNISPATTNTVASVIQLQRQSSGTAANGIGTKIEFASQTSDGVLWQSNEVISKWTTANTATRVSQYIINGVNNAITADLFTLNGSGETRLNKYGVGTFTAGTATYLAAYKSDGTLMEYPAGGLPGGGALITADEGLTTSSSTNVRLFGTIGTPATITTDRYLTGGSNMLNMTFNSLAGSSGLSISSTSTAATGDNLQRIVSIVKSGTQVNSVNSSALYVENSTIPGFGSFAYGVYSKSTIPSGSGQAYAFRAEVTNQTGLWATATTGTAILAQSSAAGTSGYTIGAFNSSTGPAIQGQSTSGVGVHGISASGSAFAGYFDGSTGGGVHAEADDGLVGDFKLNFSANPDASVQTLLKIAKSNGAVVNDGSGLSIDLYLSSTTTSQLSNQLISKWATAANATRTSQLIFTGVTSATTQDWLILGQSGYVKFRPMTVTEAGAITTAEGLMVFVSNTDATFTSVGLWIYQNGAWKAL